MECRGDPTLRDASLHSGSKALTKHDGVAIDDVCILQGCQLQDVQQELDRARRRLQASEAAAERLHNAEHALQRELHTAQQQGMKRSMLPPASDQRWDAAPQVRVRFQAPTERCKRASCERWQLINWACSRSANEPRSFRL